MDIDPISAQRIAHAAQHVALTKRLMEKSQNPDERLLLQKQLELAEEEMINASMVVNRGISRAPTT